MILTQNSHLVSVTLKQKAWTTSQDAIYRKLVTRIMLSLLSWNCTISSGCSFSSTPGHLGVIHSGGICGLSVKGAQRRWEFHRCCSHNTVDRHAEHLINVITLAQLHHKSEAEAASNTSDIKWVKLHSGVIWLLILYRLLGEIHNEVLTMGIPAPFNCLYEMQQYMMSLVHSFSNPRCDSQVYLDPMVGISRKEMHFVQFKSGIA